MTKFNQLDLSSCDKEPINIPGAIQPFAWLIVVDQQWFVRSVSANFINELEQPRSAILGRAFTDIEFLKDVNPTVELCDNHVQTIVVKGIRYSVHLNSIPGDLGWRSIEIERAEPASDQVRDPQSQSQRIIEKLMSSSDQNSLFNNLLTELRSFVGYDRCMVYMFDEQWNGSVVAEAKEDNLEPFLGLHYPATDIPVQARILYEKKLTRLIENVNYVSVPLISVASEDTPIDLSYVDARAISPIHVQYLNNMGVTATLVISLIVNKKLWGLVACHHYQGKKYLNYEMRKSCETIALMTALFIERLDVTFLHDRKQHLRQVLNISDIIKFIDNPGGDTYVADRILRQSQSDGVAWIDEGEIKKVGLCLSDVGITTVIAAYFQQKNLIWYVDSVKAVLSPAVESDLVSGFCVVGLLSKKTDSKSTPFLILFRKEAIEEVNWAGDPHEKHPVIINSVKSLSPRRSFAIWKEVMKDRCSPWNYACKTIIEELHTLLLEANLLQVRATRQQELKAIADSTDLGIWSLDVASGNLYWSDRMFELYGISREMFDNGYASWTECLLETDREAVRLAFESAVYHLRPFQKSFRIMHPQKGVRTLRAHANMVLSDTGMLKKVVGTNVDITDELAMSEALQLSIDVSASQARLVSLGELSATIGHEINNPLAIILSSLELQLFALQKSSPSLDDVLQTNKRATTAADRISKIVAGLSSLARSRSSESKNPSCFLPDAIIEIKEMMTELLRKDNVVITTDIFSQTPYAAIDVTAVQQVLINLINNAKDAMETNVNKPILIKNYIEGNWAVITVTDTGPGITKDKAEQIFLPFFTTKERGKGTGLGLSISRSLLREVGGDLKVKSSLGHGTVFKMMIPLSKVVENKTVSDQKNTQLKLSVLLVDDEEMLRSAIRQQLEYMGCTVEDVASAAQAEHILLSRHFDVLLVDSHMPITSGEQLLKNVHSVDSKRILMTGDVTKSYSELMRKGVPLDAIVFKPVRFNDLLQLLETFCQH